MNNRKVEKQSPLVLAMLGTIVALILAIAQGAQAQNVYSLATPGTGALTAISPSGKKVTCPLEHTEVQVSISGFLARGTVVQTFHNPLKERIEAVYVFPLGAQAAVDDMTMHIGNRTIRGLIKERGEAERIYENALKNGQTASLLTQERPNIFTQAVANIMPGERIEIEISYVEYLTYEKGTLSMAFPMVVGPRFIPGASVNPDGQVSQISQLDQTVFDGDRITPPVMPEGMRAGHDISVSVEIDAGVSFTNLRSPSHKIIADQIGTSTAMVRLDSLDRIPNKDFILKWDVDPARVETGFLTHADNGSGFFSLLLVPSVHPQPADVTPKEMVFVLDCSGSMYGSPMDQAKALVRHAISNMNPQDTFTIIRFSENATALGPRPLPNTPENIDKGLAYIDQLSGMGGTMMIEGIKAALDFPKDENRLRIVMFLTDGYIGNDDEILAEIDKRRGDTRLFSFGVGSSTNRYLLENMATVGRGAVQFVRYEEDPQPVVDSFYDSIRSPMLTHLVVDWDGLEITDLYPRLIPDVFAGHPVQITGRFTKPGEGVIRVTGRLGNQKTSFPVRVSLPEQEPANSALRSLWARRAIEDRTMAMLRGQTDELVAEVTKLSIENRVLSQYTAFVAVEDRVRTNERGEPVRVEVPVEIPDGVSFEGVFGKSAEKREMGYAGVSKGIKSRTISIASLRSPTPAPQALPSARLSGVRGGGGMTRNVTKQDSADEELKEPSDDKPVKSDVRILKVSGLVPAMIKARLTAWRLQIQACLDKTRKAGKTVPASLTIQFVTDKKGRIVKVTFGRAVGLESSLATCLETKLRKIGFSGAGSVTVEVDL